MSEDQGLPKPGELMYNTGIAYFSEGFNNKSTAPYIQWIIEMNLLPKSQRPKELTLVINSPGGSVHAAFALIDTMKGSKIPIRTVGLGLIASCGILTFMAGTKGRRVVTPNTSILSHQTQVSSVTNIVGAVQARNMNCLHRCVSLNLAQSV